MTVISQHSLIAAAVVDALKALPAIASGRIFRSRTRQISSSDTNGVVVRLVRSSSADPEMMGGRTQWKTLISIECYGRGNHEVPESGADEVVVAVFERLASNPTLDGLAMDLAPFDGSTLEWDFDEMDTTMCSITAHFVVTHQTTERLLT